MEIAHIQNRLAELRVSSASCEEQLRLLEQRTRELEQTRLRIAGAIQVLEEIERELQAKQDGS